MHQYGDHSSNFGSNTHPAPTGSRQTVAAAIGATGMGTGTVTGNRAGRLGGAARERFGLPTTAR